MAEILKLKCNKMFDLWLLFFWFYTSVVLVDTESSLALFLALIASYSWQIFPVTVFIDKDDSVEQAPAGRSSVWLCPQVTLPQDVCSKKCLSCPPQSGSAVGWVAKWIVVWLCCLMLLSLFFISFHILFKLRCTLPNVINVLQNSLSCSSIPQTKATAYTRRQKLQQN